MIAWRIAKRRYSNRESVLSREGAEECGGRWNAPGLRLIYASESSSLALLETLVHTSSRRLPKSLVAVTIRVPQNAGVRTISLRDLPADWREPDNRIGEHRGSTWIRSNATLVLRVPSAVNPLESSILLNPGHPDIARCTVGVPIAINFDPRLIALFGEVPRRRAKR
ncbi:MAG: RES domain-containing protein [Candidatus Eremiobacteraeota bacterium]|nr:RES domain-containing protein [Candidatus Eremiobacteraeota bacterium]MBC5802573.1 RES domain-containing protein [Candidatus Eremiobacteraeota bacterium]MBC5821854.1 RES domain-containing protein [Candidatus Eremiobacteraeota bacterium]